MRRASASVLADALIRARTSTSPRSHPRNPDPAVTAGVDVQGIGPADGFFTNFTERRAVVRSGCIAPGCAGARGIPISGLGRSRRNEGDGDGGR